MVERIDFWFARLRRDTLHGDCSDRITEGPPGPFVVLLDGLDIVKRETTSALRGPARVGARPAGTTRAAVLFQVKYTDQPHRCEPASVPGMYCFRSGEACLLLDRIKREKGVWWMPWQQEAMKDVVLCDKPWGAENRL